MTADEPASSTRSDRGDDRFDEIAGTYDDLVDSSISFGGLEHEFFTRRKAEVLVDLARRRLGDPASISVLDVGCGTGLTDTALGTRFGELHGTDPAAEALAVAAKRNPGVDYRTSTADRLPYDDGTFDLAFAICVVHHIDGPERQGFARELGRVVRPGGLIAILEHNPWNPLTRVAVSRCDFDEDVELLSGRQLRRLLRSADLPVVEARYILFFPFARRWTPSTERVLGRVALGAQHYAVAQRP